MYILFSLHEQKIAYQNVSSLLQCHISGLQHQFRQNKLLDYSYKRKTRSVMIYTLFNCPKVDIHLDIKAEEDEKKIYTKKCEKNDIKSLKRATVKQCTKLSKTTATIFLLNSWIRSNLNRFVQGYTFTDQWARMISRSHKYHQCMQELNTKMFCGLDVFPVNLHEMIILFQLLIRWLGVYSNSIDGARANEFYKPCFF